MILTIGDLGKVNRGCPYAASCCNTPASFKNSQNKEGDLLGHPQRLPTSEPLVAEQKPRGDAHVIVVARAIGM